MASSGCDVSQLTEVLQQRFGLNEFREGQLAVIQKLLDGHSAAAIFPTGGGKSLCYQLPALLLPGLTVVVSPLIALMKDQTESLLRRGIPAVRLDSTLSTEEFRDCMQQVRSGAAKLMFVAPERFFNERFRESLGSFPISLFAVDEAHCISQWGHNFRPDYLKLGPIAKEYGAERVLALTATATPQVLTDICQGLEIAPENAVRTPFYRPNLQITSSVQTESSRMGTLLEMIRTKPAGPTLVYVTLQNTAETVAEGLAATGLNARPYHAGLDDQLRSDIQNWFMEEASPIVVATIAFGMGIDKSNIRYVYHYNVPKSLESYAQEIGRAGRDGLPSLCHMMLVPEDRIVLENFTYGDTPTRGAIGKFIERISGQPEQFYLSYYRLSHECDIKQLVTRTLLTYLELEGYLAATAPRYDTYQFKPRTSSKQILDHFEGEKRQFVSQILSSATKRTVWFRLDPLAIAKKLQCERSRVIKAIDYLGEKGWIELEVADLVHGYRRLQRISDPPALADQIYEQLISREQVEVGRIEQVFALALSKSCQAAMLSEHFGEQLSEPCGQCSACQKEARKYLLHATADWAAVP